MNTIKIICVGLLYFSVISYSSGLSLEQQKQALDEISNFTAEICGKNIPLVGNNEKLELSGKAKAELGNTLKKITDIGITGTVQYLQEEHSGVLQSQLIDALKQTADCKENISKLLIEKLLPKSDLSNINIPEIKGINQITIGKKSPAIISNGDVNINY